MLQEFEKAKNYLKTEIAQKNQQYVLFRVLRVLDHSVSLYFSLEDAAVKYLNREPRDADLQTIANLHTEIDGYKKHISELNVMIGFMRCC